MPIDKTLSERETRYGSFRRQAEISRRFKDVLITELGEQGKYLPPYQMEALEMILHKIARIINGDPFYPDSWHDIAGYATLVEKELSNE